MERQVKERLIGAAVLVAAAIILVPEMLSGPEKPASTPGENNAGTKTYSIDLRQSAAPQPVAEPAPPPVAAEASSATEEKADDSAESESISSDQSSTTGPAQNSETSATNPLASAPEPTPETQAPPAAVTRAPPPPATEKKPASGGWVVQVGSFTTQDKAQSVAKGLEKRGYSTFVRSATVNGKLWYRVRIGPVTERSAAESVLAKVKPSEPGASVVPQ